MTDVNDGYSALLSPNRGKWDVSIYYYESKLAEHTSLPLWDAQDLAAERLNYFRALGRRSSDG